MSDPRQNRIRFSCNSPEDEQIACLVRREIDSSRLKGLAYQLYITCDRGTVTLTGRLPSFFTKQVLQTIVGRLPGVDQVDNRVQVSSAESA